MYHVLTHLCTALLSSVLECAGRLVVVSGGDAWLGPFHGRVESHPAQALGQVGAGVVVALAVVDPPAVGDGVGGAAQGRIGGQRDVVDVGDVQVRTVIAVPGAGDGGRRWLPFPLQAAAEGVVGAAAEGGVRSEEHTSELQSLMRISYAVFCLKKNTKTKNNNK